jgi:hypothetical protein
VIVAPLSQVNVAITSPLVAHVVLYTILAEGNDVVPVYMSDTSEEPAEFFAIAVNP